jgi:hypothetical protein
MEALTRQMLSLVGASAEFTRARRAAATATPATPEEATWLAELSRAHDAMAGIAADVAALLGGLKLSAIGTFLAGANALLQALEAAAAAAAHGWAQRAAWVQALLQARGKAHARDAQEEEEEEAAPLLLAFGGARYEPLRFLPARGGGGASDAA